MECSTPQGVFNKRLKTEVCNRDLFQVPAERPSGQEEFLVLAFLVVLGCSGAGTAAEERSVYLAQEQGKSSNVHPQSQRVAWTCLCKPQGSSCESRL